jgi:hypothetical protein
MTPDARQAMDRLSREFGGHLEPSSIQRIATASVARFDDAIVRSFVPILALRTARREAARLAATTVAERVRRGSAR